MNFIESFGTTSLVLLIAVLVIIVTVIAVALKAYTVCPSDHLLIVNGANSKTDADDTSGGARVYQGGSAMVIPFLYTKSWLSLKPMSLSVVLHGALTRNNVPVNVELQMMFAINTVDKRSMQNAIRYWVGSSNGEIENEIIEISQGSLRSIVAELDIEELISDREAFNARIEAALSSEFSEVGMKLVSQNIKDINDENGYINSLGQKAAATVRERALTDTAQIEREAKIDQEEQTSLREIGILEQKRHKATESARITREETVAIADNTKQSEIAIAELKRDEEIGLAMIRATTAEETKANTLREYEADRDREVGIAKAEKAMYEARQETMVAEESNRRLVQIEVDNRKRKMEADNDAEVVTIAAAAKATEVLKASEANAKSIELELNAKAEGYKAIIDACGSAEAASQMIMLESVEKLAHINATALSNLELGNIVIMGGGSDAGSQPISNFINDFVSSMPQAHAMAKAVGVTLPSILGKPDTGSNEKSVATSDSSNA